jgi:hypothetical protein
MIVEVGKLHFVRRTDAKNPLRSFAIPPKGFLVCVDPEWVTFISGATAKPRSGDYLDSIFSNIFEESLFMFHGGESGEMVEAAPKEVSKNLHTSPTLPTTISSEARKGSI